MTVYHYASFPVVPALILAAVLALTLLQRLTTNAVRKMARARVIARSRDGVRLGYRQERRY
jgi:hypothetical protein